MLFAPADYRNYLSLLVVACRQVGTRVCGYCLMPDRVHRTLEPAGRWVTKIWWRHSSDAGSGRCRRSGGGASCLRAS